MAKNTEKNAKPYNKKARAKKNKDYPKIRFMVNESQMKRIEGIKSPGVLAKRLFFEYVEALERAGVLKHEEGEDNNVD